MSITTVARRITGHLLRGCRRCVAEKSNGNSERCPSHRAVHYHFFIALRSAKQAESASVKDWEIIADDLSKDGWSYGYVSVVDREGRTIWIADAHRDDGKRFILPADEKLLRF